MYAEDRAFFQEHGYLVVRRAVTGDTLGQLLDDMAIVQAQVESGAWRGNHLFESAGQARVIFNPYDVSPTLRALVGSDGFRGRARAMLDVPLRLDHTKLMCKRAATGTPQPPHQDYYYWQGRKANQVAVFLCLDPSTEANGCLRLIPGSQRHGLLPHHEEYHQTTGERHWVCKVPDDDQPAEIPFIAEPGDAVFFGSLTIHRSEANRSEQSRRAVIFEYDEYHNLPDRPGWGGPIPPVNWPQENDQ